MSTYENGKIAALQVLGYEIKTAGLPVQKPQMATGPAKDPFHLPASRSGGRVQTPYQPLGMQKTPPDPSEEYLRQFHRAMDRGGVPMPTP